MGQTLVSTLMDTTLRLEGLVNNIQHSNFFQCRIAFPTSSNFRPDFGTSPRLKIIHDWRC